MLALGGGCWVDWVGGWVLGRRVLWDKYQERSAVECSALRQWSRSNWACGDSAPSKSCYIWCNVSQVSNDSHPSDPQSGPNQDTPSKSCYISCNVRCLLTAAHQTHRVDPTKMNIDLDEMNVTSEQLAAPFSSLPKYAKQCKLSLRIKHVTKANLGWRTDAYPKIHCKGYDTYLCVCVWNGWTGRRKRRCFFTFCAPSVPKHFAASAWDQVATAWSHCLWLCFCEPFPWSS